MKAGPAGRSTFSDCIYLTKYSYSPGEIQFWNLESLPTLSGAHLRLWEDEIEKQNYYRQDWVFSCIHTFVKRIIRRDRRGGRRGGSACVHYSLSPSTTQLQRDVEIEEQRRDEETVRCHGPDTRLCIMYASRRARIVVYVSV